MIDSKQPPALEPVQIVTPKTHAFEALAKLSGRPQWALAAAKRAGCFDDSSLLTTDEFEAALRAALSVSVA